MTTTGVEGKCVCGWVIPLVATGLVTPPGVSIHPSFYETGTSMLVMMKCPVCRRTLRQTAPLAACTVMRPDEAQAAFEAFGRVAVGGPLRRPS